MSSTDIRDSDKIPMVEVGANSYRYSKYGICCLLVVLMQSFRQMAQRMLYFQSETTFERIDGVGHIIPQAYRYIIYNLITGQSQELNIPKNYKTSGVDWMDGATAIVLSAWQINLNEMGPDERNYDIYKYDILRGELTRLIDDVKRNDYQLDWISDDVLSVNPLDKKRSSGEQ